MSQINIKLVNFMNLIFTTEEMIKALELIGYEVRLEKSDDSDCYPGGTVVPREIEIYNVYRQGTEIVSFGKGRTYRLEYVFKQELGRRLLGLFSDIPGIRERESVTNLFKSGWEVKG